MSWMGAELVKVYAVVPLSAPPRIKTRLAGVLKPSARAALARWMAERVLGAVRAAGAVAEIAVVSPDVEALAWAASRGAVALRQEGRGLNAALEIGRQWALARGADALLVLLGDLPYLTPRDVSAMVRLLPGGDAPAAVLAPDRHERGTNALLLRPPDVLPFTFGRESFHRHEARALALGGRAVWYTSEGTRNDVDAPDDLAALVASGLWRPAAVS